MKANLGHPAQLLRTLLGHCNATILPELQKAGSIHAGNEWRLWCSAIPFSSLSVWVVFCWIGRERDRAVTSSLGGAYSHRRRVYRYDWRNHSSLLLQGRAARTPGLANSDGAFSLCPDIIDDLDAEKWKAVDDRLLDLLATDQTKGWGRPIDQFSQKRGPLREIPSNYWGEANFTNSFLQEGHEQQMHVEFTSHIAGSRQFADLHFDKAALSQAWKKLGLL